MEQLEILQRKLKREILARKEAESILEKKALELYEANERLTKMNENLELKVRQRALALTNNELKYQQLLENMELGLLEVDNDQIILRAYDGFCEMTGYSQEDLIGKNAMKILIPEKANLTEFQEEQKKRKKGQAGVYEIQIKKKDGQLIWVMISGSPVLDFNGQPTGSLGIHYDITKQKKMQRDLIESRNIAREAQIAEFQFLVRMSHEIRTPLNAIIGMFHLLTETNPTEIQQEYLGLLGNSSSILKSLITDILDFSKIQAGEITVHKSEFNVEHIITVIQKSIQAQVNKEKVIVTTLIDKKIKHLVFGDELMLNQILLNLVGNAKKFTEQGEIKITVELVNEYSDSYSLEFQVNDTGIGIAEGNLAYIFQDFKQVQNTHDEKFSGTGLGLAITKQLVALQGGEISVASRPNVGSTFTFSLNYKKGISNEHHSPQIITAPTNELFNQERILVIEDNYMNRKYILTLLDKWNLDYEVATNGNEAVALAKKSKFDLIFMDISMPGLNGYQATYIIRNSSNPNRETPIIALSASAFVSVKAKAMDSGMDDFLCKPYDPQRLKEMIINYVQKKSVLTIKTKAETASGPTFKNPLNDAHLNELYEGKWDFVLEMFKHFADSNWGGFFDIQELLKNDEFEKARMIIHKLVANISMVGLLSISKKMSALESLILQDKAKSEIIHLHGTIAQEMQSAIPVLKQSIVELDHHLSSTEINS